MLSFENEPYFDDYSDKNKFYKILFRPAAAVQARELNQIQSILQNQIKQHGNHIFKNGAMVIPGEFSIKTDIDYVKLADIGTTTSITNLIGKTVKDSNNLRALVIHAEPATNLDPATLFVSYVASGTTDGTTKTFGTSVDLQTVSGTSYTGVTTAAANPVGKSTLATVKQGVYYVNGYFVLASAQTYIVDKYNDKINNSSLSTLVGFNIVEETLTPDDYGYEMLLDNAQGSYNYGAPGAHRYFIDLVLTTASIGTPDTKFIELCRFVNSKIIKIHDKTEYSELEKTLARRTHDESGSYSISGFDIDVRPHRNNDRGDWSSSNTYYSGDIVTSSSKTYVALSTISPSSTAPTHTVGGIVNNWQYTTKPNYNRGIYPADSTVLNSTVDGVGNWSKLAIGISPGKAYVDGYEIEKIATEYVSIDKTLETESVNNQSIPTGSIGSYIEVRSVLNVPDLSLCPKVNLYNTFNGTGTVIGTCRARSIQPDSSSTDVSARLYISDVSMNSGYDFNRDVKSLKSGTFSATVPLFKYSKILTGNISFNNTGVGTGNGTLFSTELKVNDWIYFKVGTDEFLRQVNSITDNDTCGVSVAVTTVAANVAFYRIQTSLIEPNNSGLVFPLNHYATKTVSDHTYHVIDSFTGTVSGSNLTISSGVTGVTFESDISNYYVQDASGSKVTPTSVTVSGTSATLAFSTTPTTSWTVWATIAVTSTSVGRKTKTVATQTDTFLLSTGASLQTVLTLSKCDILSVVSIRDASGNDISDWYLTDDGQTASMYNRGTLTLKPSYPLPTSNVVVIYRYFQHGAGDFFDVNSYPIYNGIHKFGKINLRDAIDFRPLNYQTGSINLRLPKRGYNMTADITYYLPRKDKIAISNKGEIFHIKGSSSLSPSLPNDPSSGMLLYNLSLAPYTFNTTSDIVCSKADNRRYTMRDISNLESRINNLEYYTSLSLLEQETTNLTVTDSKGNDRFKNGFIVDNFSGQGIGNTASVDYSCSIDMENNELRPFAAHDNVDLLPNKALSSNIRLWRDVITLKQNDTTPEVELAKNPYASRTEFVNPFAVFTFIGDVKLNPASDDWFATSRRPDIVINKDGNFNAISTLAEKSGVLGTVWNAWQTQWTGTPLIKDFTVVSGGHDNSGVSATISNGVMHSSDAIAIAEEEWGVTGNPWWARTTSFETTATRTGVARSGVTTKIVATVDRQIINDRVISTAVVPYIRSRNVLVQVKGLKPNTKFYPYFDNIDVSANCTSARTLIYTPISGVFDTETNVGHELATTTARHILGDNQVCLNIGDVVTGSTSGATAVVVGKDVYTNPSTLAKTYKLYVVNLIGTFTSTETIVGSISGAQGKYVSITSSTSTLITSESGTVDLLFKIPTTDAKRFRSGEKEFKLIDSSTATGAFTSKGRASYHSTGILQTKQATVLATRNAEIVQEAVSETDTITQTSIKTLTDTGWTDPLAQSFEIKCKGGAFLSKVDIYFAAKDLNIPVTVEIREMVNGSPGKTVLPFSRVTMYPEDVLLSENTVLDYAGTSYPTFDTPTSFSFPNPVYVQDKMEYALVVMSDSNQYKIWISQADDVIPDTSTIISKQPYNGVLFKSQNGSTWSADQWQDMKFTVWRANFDTSVYGTSVLTNHKIPLQALEINPIQTLSGSKYVRVWQSNHGFQNNDYVTISDASTANGTTVNGTWSVTNSTLESYVILTTGSSASSTGFGGGSAVMATKNVKFETAHINANTLTFPNTTLANNIKTTDWDSSVLLDATPCTLNDNTFFTTPRVVNSTVNSLQVVSTLHTNNAALSPIIDTGRTSFIAVTNKIDSPVYTDRNIAGVDRVALLSGTRSFLLADPDLGTNTVSAPTYPVTFDATANTVSLTSSHGYVNGNTISFSSITSTTGISINTTYYIVNTTTGTFQLSLTSGGAAIELTTNGTGVTSNALNVAKLKSIIPGSYIKIVNVSSVNDGTYLVTSVDPVTGTLTVNKDFTFGTATSNDVLYYFASYVDEITPLGSSSASKYVSKEINLTNDCTAIRVRLAASIPTSATIEMYYKVGSVSEDFSTTNWTLLPPDNALPKTTINSNKFYDIDYTTAEDLPVFHKITIKIVMKSTDTASVPRIKDLRIIACA